MVPMIVLQEKMLASLWMTVELEIIPANCLEFAKVRLWPGFRQHTKFDKNPQNYFVSIVKHLLTHKILIIC